MNKHTPGPWKIGHSQSEEPAIRIGDGTIDDDCVAICCELLEGEAEANAALIAAAPDLFAALEKALCYMEADSDDEQERADYAEARAAIAQAKGEA